MPAPKDPIKYIEYLNNMSKSMQLLPFRDSKPERMMQIALTLNDIKFKNIR